MNPPIRSEQTRIAASAVKPQRVLACMLCQQRKVKCDHKVPCQNCVKAGAQCVPTTSTRSRRRRFPERELLDRLHYYEDLLRQNNINFEPLHAPVLVRVFPNIDSRGNDSPENVHLGGQATRQDEPSTQKTTVKSEAVYEAKNLWHAMNQKSPDPDDGDDDDSSDSLIDGVRDLDIKKAWDQSESHDHLLLGSPKTNVDISSLHPERVQIFKLWQIYLENVNPLLKVIHAPTLQTCIIDAAGDIGSISPSLEALLFSIYCVAIHSLVEDECLILFRSSRKDLLANYQSSCQQALLKCEFLRSSNRDCLTALYLYLISVRPDTDARSLSSMLGAAIRIAQRMGIHNESDNAKCTVFEAEMRRRLWWSLVIFDARISEKSDHKDAVLIPTWNCMTPLNVNDLDIWPEMRTSPAVHAESTEALFIVVRSELSDFTRHSLSHLDFVNSVLKSVAKDIQHDRRPEGDELVTLEKTIEDKYLKFCNLENPLHFATLWTARGYLAKSRLLEHYSRCSRSPVEQMDTQRNLALSHALEILECDTKLLTSPLTKSFQWWLTHLQFPFPAYLHIVQDLKRRSVGELAEKSWNVLSDNCKVRFAHVEEKDNHFFMIFSIIILQAWAAREAVLRQSDEPEVLPWIVSNIRRMLAQMTPNAQNSSLEQLDGSVGLDNDGSSMPMPIDFIDDGLLYSFGGQVPVDSGLGMSGQATMNPDVNQAEWSVTDFWHPLYRHDW